MVFHEDFQDFQPKKRELPGTPVEPVLHGSGEAPKCRALIQQLLKQKTLGGKTLFGPGWPGEVLVFAGCPKIFLWFFSIVFRSAHKWASKRDLKKLLWFCWRGAFCWAEGIQLQLL